MDVNGGVHIHMQPMDVNDGMHIHMQPMEYLMPNQADMPEGGCHFVGSPYWNRFLTGPVDPWRQELTLKQVCWQDLRPLGGPTVKQTVPE